MEKWRQYCDKFLSITPREQYLIALTGLVVIVLILFNFSIDGSLTERKKYREQVRDDTTATRSNADSIALFQASLAKDPNKSVNEQISNIEKQLTQVDKELLTLTSDLIDPVQMRFALIDLLKMQKGVSLVSLQVLPPEPLIAQNTANTEDSADGEATQGTESTSEETSNEEVGLYKHQMVIKLSGGYFQLRDYLEQLEQMSWKFFWQDFQYQLKEYPTSELEVRLYSLSTKREFIGV